MNRTVPGAATDSPTLAAAIATASRIIAPTWPLDEQIAINPWWGMIDRPFAEVAALLHRLNGAPLAWPAQAYLAAWESGEITSSALERALHERCAPAGVTDALAALRTAPGCGPGLDLPSDLIDRQPDAAGPRWRETITQQVSQFCASYFDADQADWHRRHPAGLFAGWRAALQRDHAIEPLMHAPRLRAFAAQIPQDAEASIDWALKRLAVPVSEAEPLLMLSLLRINGWASWCAYRAWAAARAGREDRTLEELLAIRISWEALLIDCDESRTDTAEIWRDHWPKALQAAAVPGRCDIMVWQRAHEIAYQDRLAHRLRERDPGLHEASPTAAPTAQLVFCIDVRSERLRRSLEDVDPTIRTHGFAGFFGLAARYAPLGSAYTRPQLPGLLAPTLTLSDTTGRSEDDDRIAERRAQRLAASEARRPFQRTATGAFSLVESLGLGFAGTLLRRHFGGDSPPAAAAGLTPGERRALRPELQPHTLADTGQRADLLAAILRAMGLTRRFARLLVFVGHASQSANNPQSAALDCGACGGQSGETNARALAALANDPGVRARLAERGIVIPANTVALGALHNTTTDEVEVFEDAPLAEETRAELRRLRAALATAGERARIERAADLGLAPLALSPASLLHALRKRARDWAQTRPEWGLANNAAFIIGPRQRTLGVNLEGRAFLHDYDWTEDREGSLLEAILTGPMVVTHWINLQYFASTVDPQRFGSGNKVLHNVVGGRIGVFEGNTGDLRIGLSRQSVHDGERWMHAPLRLTVTVDAPRGMLEAILDRQPTVRELVANEWLHLFRFADPGLERLQNRRWQALDASPETG